MEILNKTHNSIQTSLITFGNPSSSNGKDTIICITGNPGFVDFYLEFGQELHSKTGLPVCIIGHAGHDNVSDMQCSKLQGQEHLFNLKGQLKHKLDLLDNIIDNKSKLHFVGHSIGSWFVIELLQNYDHLYKKTLSINLLFPTIQRMAKSKNGIWLNNYVRKIHGLVLFLIKLICFLPERVSLFLINIYLRLCGLPAHYDKRFLKYLNPHIFEKVLFLAFDEMDNVTTLNKEGVDKVKHLTNIIYSVDDGWAPLSFMKDLMIYQPYLQMIEVNTDHAFIFKSSQFIAFMVSDFIKHKISAGS
ncbi:unnamed protein product [Parnassius mnemosyne]|uniref:Lipid droplet-associated hydrolase n=1 Tax=Parnassius mnemosyne TaxID=213953 RepID=A0AAV1M7F8_9NEOP